MYLAGSTGDNFIEGTNGASGNFSTTDSFRIFVVNASMFGSDSVSFSASGDTSPSTLAHPEVDVVNLKISLSDTDGTVFSDDSLPATLNLSDFEGAWLSLSARSFNEREGPTGRFSVRATITSIASVPEPSTLLLGAMASVGLLVWRRRAS